MKTAIKFQLLTHPFTKPRDIIASMINLNEHAEGLLAAFLYFVPEKIFFSEHLQLILIVVLKGKENSQLQSHTFISSFSCLKEEPF